MRIAILFVIIVSGFVSSFAQKVEKWRVLAPADEEFSIDVPVELSYSYNKGGGFFSDNKSEDISRNYGKRPVPEGGKKPPMAYENY